MFGGDRREDESSRRHERTEITSLSPPRDLGGLKALLMESRDALPPRLIQAAAFALENPDEIALGTAASIAAQASVQPSTLIRLAKRLGYSGFSDDAGRLPRRTEIELARLPRADRKGERPRNRQAVRIP